MNMKCISSLALCFDEFHKMLSLFIRSSSADSKLLSSVLFYNHSVAVGIVGMLSMTAACFVDDV